MDCNNARNFVAAVANIRNGFSWKDPCFIAKIWLLVYH